MRTGHYTRLKGRVTYFRRKVPEILQVRLASTEICYRLGVISSQLAERLGRTLAVEVDSFFERAKIDPMLKSADLTKLVQTALAEWREASNAGDAKSVHSFGKPIANPRDSATALAELGLALIERNGEGPSTFDASLVNEIAQKADLPIITNEVAAIAGGRALSMALAAHYLRSAVEVASLHGLSKGWRALPVADWQERLAALERHLGLDDKRQIAAPAPTVFQRELPVLKAQETAGLLPDLAEINAIEASPESRPDISFSKLVDICLDSRIAAKEVKPGLRQEMVPSLKIWLQVVGDKPIGEYGRADFVKFRSALLKIPTIYWKSAASRELSIVEVIEHASKAAVGQWTKTATAKELDDVAAMEKASRNYARIGPTTVNRHLSTIAPVFAWAAGEGMIPEEARPFWDRMQVKTGIKVTGLKPNQERPPYTHDQILEIAQHPIWTGRKSDYFYNSQGTVIVRDSLYWGFPIALLHGLRREEFAQLKVKHVRQIDDIWVFDLHEIEVDVKQGASRRYVPLHDKLLALGFLEAAVLGRPKDERLFPELAAGDDTDRFGDSLGKRFSRVLDHLEIVVIRKNGTESDGCYHPLRHRFVTDLGATDVKDGIIDYLSGHTSEQRNGERLRYQDDPPVAVLKEAIEKLPVVVDFAPWIEAWKRCSKP